MTDRLRPPDERQVEEALRELGTRLDYPPTPEFARQVRARLAAAPPRRSRWSLLAAPAARRIALTLVVLAALVGIVLALSPAARNAVAGRLGIPGINITYVTPVPTAYPPAPTTTSTPVPATTIPSATRPASATAAGTPPGATTRTSAAPTPVGAHLFLGQLLTLEAVRARVSFPVLVPALPELGPADEVYYDLPPAGGMVSLVWHARPGLPAVADTGVGLLL